METHIKIEKYVRNARVERNVCIAELTADAIVATWNGIKYAADVLLSVARDRTRKQVFMLDV